ncbi:aminopeptidase N [Luteococcus sp. Sow4_B9]|uniref:aminopeptidase N n=1 Tax=Luteococcus sp. Sow4_B9 TaxID=3438792 RepID=UPI003F98F850
MSTANITRDEAIKRSAGLSVESYHVTLDLRGAQDQMRGTFGVHDVVVVDATIDHAHLDFLDGTVHRVMVNGEWQRPDYDGARFSVALEQGRNVIEIDAEASYSRSGQGMHRFVDPLDGQTYLYTHFEPADARRVFPNFEQPDLKAVHNITVLAPEGWLVRSNQPRIAGGTVKPEPGEEGLPMATRHAFGPTPPLSTYLTCVIAGPWHEVTDSWQSGDGLEVPLGHFCRQSLVEHFDHERILTVTKQGLDFFHQHFGFPYPWGKYDQVFVPEYNLGAMENPGLVTFTEHYLFRSAASRTQYQGRANTILHEMAHMWFGDLVTPQWWDDLWLKESFAEFMGGHVSVEATEFQDAWVALAGRRKAWAYNQDQLPTTHPIVADIPDIEAARQNFDGITYAKGAAVLKQLVSHVGVEDFFAGSRVYFAKHAYGSARLDDLLDALHEVSGRDLQDWSRRWLQTAGPDTLSPVIECADGRITRLGIRQHSVDARDGSFVGRPHTLVVGLYVMQGGALVRRDRFQVELDGSELTWIPQATGLPEADLVLVNDEDLTYAKTELDERSLATVAQSLSTLDDALARALVWSSLWNLTRDAQLRVESYVEAVRAHGLIESDDATMVTLLDNARFAINNFVPNDLGAHLNERSTRALWDALQTAAPGSDAQLAMARAVAAMAGRVPAMTGPLQGLLDGSSVPAGLEVGAELRWELANALAALGAWGEDELDAELTRDPGKDGVTARLRALAARPDSAVKAQVWQQLHEPGALSNDHMDALIAGFTTAGQEALVAPITRGYFDDLLDVWRSHSIELATRLVAGLFPRTDEAPEQAQTWLQENPEAPGALRRLVLECTDGALRARRAREFNA